MEMKKELLAKAKNTKTPEELLCLAQENGEEMTEESAKAYFELLHPKTGKIADEELDNVAGGGCHTDDGREIVTVGHGCTGFECKKCGSKNIIIGLIKREVSGSEKSEPAPKSSRIAPIRVKTAVKPTPIPRPSSTLGSTEFLDANISARARIIQFTTISGRYIPRDLSISGKNAFTSI